MSAKDIRKLSICISAQQMQTIKDIAARDHLTVSDVLRQILGQHLQDRIDHPEWYIPQLPVYPRATSKQHG